MLIPNTIDEYHHLHNNTCTLTSLIPRPWKQLASEYIVAATMQCNHIGSLANLDLPQKPAIFFLLIISGGGLPDMKKNTTDS